MAISVKQWRSVIAESADILGDDWHVAGKGRLTALVRSRPQWLLQFVYQEPTSNGRLVAYQGLLSAHLPWSESGQGGVTGGQFRDPDFPDRRFSDVSDPAVVAAFAQAATRLKLDPVFDVSKALEVEEDYYVRNCDRGNEDRIYSGMTLRRLISLRVLCSSRPLPDLVSDVRRVLDDDNFSSFGILGDRSPDRGEARNRAMWQDLFVRLEAADRPAVQELLAQTRFDSLRAFGLAEEDIPDPIFPEPEVQW